MTDDGCKDSEVRQPSCFVICPIGDADGEVGSPGREIFEQSIEVYEEVILPACKAFGLDPVRADQLSRPGEIPEQVCRRLREDDVVIADLTGGNANVMYELGLRHTTPKLTIQLGERGRLPFDVAAIRTILFRRTPGGLIQARKRLSEVLSSGLSSGGDPVTATRVWLGGELTVAPDTEDISGEEAGILEKLVDLEEFSGGLAASMNRVSSIMEGANKLMKEAGEKAEKLNARGEPASARLVVANRLASNLEGPAAELEEVSQEFELSVEKVQPGIRYILSVPKGGPDEEAIEVMRESLRGTMVPTEKYVESVNELIGILSSAGEITRSLRKVNGRLRAALSRLVKTSKRILSWRELLSDGS